MHLLAPDLEVEDGRGGVGLHKAEDLLNHSGDAEGESALGRRLNLAHEGGGGQVVKIAQDRIKDIFRVLDNASGKKKILYIIKPRFNARHIDGNIAVETEMKIVQLRQNIIEPLGKKRRTSNTLVKQIIHKSNQGIGLHLGLVLRPTNEAQQLRCRVIAGARPLAQIALPVLHEEERLEESRSRAVMDDEIALRILVAERVPQIGN